MKKILLRRCFFILCFILFIALLFRVWPAVLPFLLGFAIAYVLNPCAEFLRKRNLSRRSAVIVLVIWITGIMGTLFFLFLPNVYAQLGELLKVLPEKMALWESYARHLRGLYLRAGVPPEMDAVLLEQWQDIENILLSKLENLVNALPGLAAQLGVILLAPVLAVYFLMDWDRVIAGVKSVVPQAFGSRWRNLLRECNALLRNYILGSLLEALLVGFLIGLGLKLVGMEYTVVLGAFCGLTNLIPYFGPFIGGALAAVLALTISPWMILKVLLVVIIVQQLEGDLITPRLMGSRLGLHPLWVIFALLVGGELAGVLGLILAIPAMALLKVILKEVYLSLVQPKLLFRR